MARGGYTCQYTGTDMGGGSITSCGSEEGGGERVQSRFVLVFPYILIVLLVCLHVHVLLTGWSVGEGPPEPFRSIPPESFPFPP